MSTLSVFASLGPVVHLTSSALRVRDHVGAEPLPPASLLRKDLLIIFRYESNTGRGGSSRQPARDRVEWRSGARMGSRSVGGPRLRGWDPSRPPDRASGRGSSRRRSTAFTL